MIRTTVTGAVFKQCPFKNELDSGEVELTFDGDAPELHGLAELLASYRQVKMSHEDFTREMLVKTAAVSARSTWTTAGLRVVVEGSTQISSAFDALSQHAG